MNIIYNYVATFNSCNTGMSALPDVYTRSPRAEGGHIRQNTSDCYNYYVTLSHSEFIVCIMWLVGFDCEF